MKKYRIVLLLLCIGALFVIIRQELQRREHAEYMHLYMQVYVERIENTVNRSVEGGLLLESVIRNLEQSFNEDTYNYVARDLFDENTMISISYMPKGIVQWIYPPSEDNLKVLGLNVFEFEGTKQGAYEAKRAGKYMISGPLELKSGQKGLTVRTPIFDNDSIFWGFVSIVYDSIEIAYEALEVKVLEELGYKYAIHSTYNDANTLLLKSEDFDYEKAFHSTLNIADNKWDFYLYSDEYSKKAIVHLAANIFEGIGLCAILWILTLYWKRRQKLIHDQIYLDPLTKLYNRKKLEATMSSKTGEKNKGFTLFYMDLNKFKPVNDTFGHAVGDKLLVAFGSRLKHRFDNNASVVRLGGDEFLLILDTELERMNAESIIQRLVEMSEEVFFIDSYEIHISTSVGYASFPTDGSTIDEVLQKADTMMYLQKQQRKDR